MDIAPTLIDTRRLVILAADHNGVNLKEVLAGVLRREGYWPIDIGPATRDYAVDYVDYARQAGEMIRDGSAARAILICGTGVGMSIASNKIRKIRATVAHNVETALKSREHNDTNVLCLGSWIHTVETNIDLALAWLAEPFGEYRHVRRVARIEAGDGIVFTNGCFDLLHRGHIELLHWAVQLGSRLVVGLNTDESVRQLKGAGRPVVRFADRKAALEAIRYVDQVLPFDDSSRHAMLEAIGPAVFVKGGEWTADEVRARDEIPPQVQVRVFPLLKGAADEKYSTTGLIEAAAAAGQEG